VIYIPIRLIYILKLSRTDIWGMALVAGVGSISMLIAIIRFAVLYTALEGNVDMQQFVLKTFVWSCIEETVGQCATCMPAFRVLFHKKNTSNNRSSNNYHSKLLSNSTKTTGSTLQSNTAEDIWTGDVELVRLTATNK
jgi:hypothetical protein